jgi:hypothetical protein
MYSYLPVPRGKQTRIDQWDFLSMLETKRHRLIGSMINWKYYEEDIVLQIEVIKGKVEEKVSSQLYFDILKALRRIQ